MVIEPLDTHSAVKQLKTTGMNESQAETLVGVIKGLFVGDLATKADIKDVVQETTLIRSEIKDLRVDIAEFKTEVKTDIADLRNEFTEFKAEIKGDIADLRNEFAEFKTEIKTDIADFKAEVKNDIAEFKTEVKGDIAGLRNEFTGFKSDLIWVKRLLMVLVLAVVSAAVKYIIFV